MVSPEKKVLFEKTMREAMDRFAARYRKDPVFTQRYRSGDESELEDIVRAACAAHGVDYDEYTLAVDADPQLSALHKRSLKEILLGPVERARDSAKRLPDVDDD